MTTTKRQPAAAQRSTRWFHLTPDRFVIALLIVEGFLLLSEGFHWFPKGCAVLVTIANVVAAIFSMLLWFADSLLYRRRFQFGIRSLLLFTVAIAIPCSWLANEIRWEERQRETLAEIDKKYGKYFFSVGTYSYPVDELGWPTYWPRRVLGNDFFVSVHYVFLTGRVVADAVLDKLKGLRELQKLDLEQTYITDAGLERLKGLTQLQELYIWDSSVTDVGLEHLEGLTQLRKLRLNCTQISDAGLEHLKGLTSLRDLCLLNTKVTDPGIKNLRQTLPNCKIEYYKIEYY